MEEESTGDLIGIALKLLTCIRAFEVSVCIESYDANWQETFVLFRSLLSPISIRWILTWAQMNVSGC